jgi:hypothetical protein
VKSEKISFDDLAKFAQVSRTPCGKQAFSMKGAESAARDRNKFTKAGAWYPVVCFDGCGRDVFHLTGKRPRGKARAMFEKRAEARRRAKRVRERRSRARARSQICVWEGEGGSYGD